MDGRTIFTKSKEKNQVYYKTDTHYNQKGAFITVQALKKKVDGKADSLKSVKFNKLSENYAGDLADLCEMKDTFNDDIQYAIEPSSVSSNKKSDKKVLVIGDSFSEHMNDIMSLYFSEVHTVNVWSFTTDLLTEYQPDIVVWECAERYTDRFQWISLFG